jgi:hypothetical protein
MPARSPALVVREPKPVTAPINFRMPDDFVQRFKARAVADRLKLNELLSRSFEASDLPVNRRAENMPSEQDEQDEQQQAIHDAAITPKKSAARPIRGKPEYKPNEHQDPIRNGH